MRREMYVLADDAGWVSRFAEHACRPETGGFRCFGFCREEEFFRRLEEKFPGERAAGDEDGTEERTPGTAEVLPVILISGTDWEALKEERKEFLLRSGAPLALLVERGASAAEETGGNLPAGGTHLRNLPAGGAHLRNLPAGGTHLREIGIYQSADAILNEVQTRIAGEENGNGTARKNRCPLVVLYSPAGSGSLGKAGWIAARILAEHGRTLLADLEDFPYGEYDVTPAGEESIVAEQGVLSGRDVLAGRGGPAGRGDSVGLGGSAGRGGPAGMSPPECPDPESAGMPEKCLSDLLYLCGENDFGKDEEDAGNAGLSEEDAGNTGLSEEDAGNAGLSLEDYTDHCGRLDILRPCSEPEDIWTFSGESAARLFGRAAVSGQYDAVVVAAGPGRDPFPLLREADRICLITEDTPEQRARTGQFLDLLRRRGEVRLAAACEQWTLPAENESAPMDRALVYGQTGRAIRDYVEKRGI